MNEALTELPLLDATSPLRRTVAGRESEVHLLVRDPDYAVAMWEITGADVAWALDALAEADPKSSADLPAAQATDEGVALRLVNGARVVLRVRAWDPGKGQPATWDTDLDAWNDSRHVPLTRRHSHHQAAVGVCSGRTQLFVPVARSNVLVAPAPMAATAIWGAPPPAPADGDALGFPVVAAPELAPERDASTDGAETP